MDLVKNANDKEQVRNAVRKEQLSRDKELNDLRAILSTAEGRRVIWRLLGHCKVHGSIWEQSARIHYNAGVQDVGHFIMAEVIAAGEEFLFNMMKEGSRT